MNIQGLEKKQIRLFFLVSVLLLKKEFPVRPEEMHVWNS